MTVYKNTESGMHINDGNSCPKKHKSHQEYLAVQQLSSQMCSAFCCCLFVCICSFPHFLWSSDLFLDPTCNFPIPYSGLKKTTTPHNMSIWLFFKNYKSRRKRNHAHSSVVQM